MDFRDSVIGEIQGWGWGEFITFWAMFGLLLFGVVLTAENASAECAGTYHQDTRCLISVSDCWGAANHECRTHKQMAKCINYSDDAYDYWNTTLNITQTKYDSGLCKCSYWCMNVTKATTSTSTSQKWITVATSTTTTTTFYWITLPQDITLPKLPQTTQPPQQQPTTPKQQPKPTDQLLLWAIILIFMIPATIQDLKTKTVSRILTLGFSIVGVGYALIQWNTDTLIAAALSLIIAYCLHRIQETGFKLGDVLISPGFGATYALLQPNFNEILLATATIWAFLIPQLLKHGLKTRVPIIPLLLIYYLTTIPL